MKKPTLSSFKSKSMSRLVSEQGMQSNPNLLWKEIQTLRKGLADAMISAKENAETAQSLRSEMDQLRNRNHELKQENDELVNDLQDALQDNEDLHDKLNDVSKRATTVMHKLTMEQRKKTALEEEIEIGLQEREQMKDMLHMISSENLVTEDKLHNSMKRNAELQAEVEKIQNFRRQRDVDLGEKRVKEVEVSLNGGTMNISEKWGVTGSEINCQEHHVSVKTGSLGESNPQASGGRDYSIAQDEATQKQKLPRSKSQVDIEAPCSSREAGRRRVMRRRCSDFGPESVSSMYFQLEENQVGYDGRTENEKKWNETWGGNVDTRQFGDLMRWASKSFRGKANSSFVETRGSRVCTQESEGSCKKSVFGGTNDVASRRPRRRASDSLLVDFGNN